MPDHLSIQTDSCEAAAEILSQLGYKSFQVSQREQPARYAPDLPEQAWISLDNLKPLWRESRSYLCHARLTQVS